MDDAARRGRLQESQLTRLAVHLTDRDRQIALDCYEHRVLTTAQLLRLHFTDPRYGRQRLHALYQLRVIDRFRPATPIGGGSAPYHWVLDQAGAHIVAAHHAVTAEQLHYRHAATLAIETSSKLTHQVEVNELFSRLASEAAHAGGALTEWYGERTLHRVLGGTVMPDGYGVLCLPGRAPIHLLLELDRDTEPAARLTDKARRYPPALAASALADTQPIILLAVPSAARAKAARTAVSGALATIAVTEWSAADPQPLLASLARHAATSAPTFSHHNPHTGEARPPPAGEREINTQSLGERA